MSRGSMESVEGGRDEGRGGREREGREKGRGRDEGRGGRREEEGGKESGEGREGIMQVLKI